MKRISLVAKSQLIALQHFHKRAKPQSTSFKEKLLQNQKLFFFLSITVIYSFDLQTDCMIYHVTFFKYFFYINNFKKKNCLNK